MIGTMLAQCISIPRRCEICASPPRRVLVDPIGESSEHDEHPTAVGEEMITVAQKLTNTVQPVIGLGFFSLDRP